MATENVLRWKVKIKKTENWKKKKIEVINKGGNEIFLLV